MGAKEVTQTYLPLSDGGKAGAQGPLVKHHSACRGLWAGGGLCERGALS